jgi:hypothetical protein
MRSDPSLYRLEWSPDGTTVKEVIFPNGKPIHLIRWKMKEMRRTSHKTGQLITVRVK